MKRSVSLWLVILFAPLFALGIITGFPVSGYSAATITIVNQNPAGVGFNDPTPVAPVGGNPGTTLGEQRLIAFQTAADIWAAHLDSAVPIEIAAQFTSLSCTATSGTLGTGAPTSVWRDFLGAPFGGTWYPKALANKLVGSDLDPSLADMSVRFNADLGNPGCLPGTPFYLGLDNNFGTQIDFVTEALKVIAQGLGFSNTTSGTTGAFLAGYPNVFDHFVLDLTIGKTWAAMTDAERVTSATNARKVVWAGPLVTAAVPLVLTPGTPVLTVTAPSSVAGRYMVGTASFGPALSTSGIAGEMMPIIGDACAPLTGANAIAATGKVVLIDRGTCNFTVKVKNAQNVGALAVVIADNAAGSPPTGIGGIDPTITIPSVRITQTDGVKLKDALKYRSRTHSGVFVKLSLDSAVRAGADPLGRALLFTPYPYQSGYSGRYWDTSATPGLLMEPNLTIDLTHNVDAPWDLTLPLLKDIGW